jgi:hypothetical protein
LVDLSLDAIHLQRNFSGEDDMRPQLRTARAVAHLGQAAIDRPILHRPASSFLFAARFGPLAMHVHQPYRTSPLMQIAYILRAEKEAIAQVRL